MFCITIEVTLLHMSSSPLERRETRRASPSPTTTSSTTPTTSVIALATMRRFCLKSIIIQYTTITKNTGASYMLLGTVLPLLWQRSWHPCFSSAWSLTYCPLPQVNLDTGVVFFYFHCWFSGDPCLESHHFSFNGGDCVTAIEKEKCTSIYGET